MTSRARMAQAEAAPEGSFSTFRAGGGMGSRASTEAMQLALQRRSHKKQQQARLADAVRMKDDQLRILQDQNRKLLDAVEESENGKSALSGRLSEVESASLLVQDENLELQKRARMAVEDGRLQAETQMRRDVEAGQHQLKIMADQNTVREKAVWCGGRLVVDGWLVVVGKERFAA